MYVSYQGRKNGIKSRQDNKTATKVTRQQQQHNRTTGQQDNRTTALSNLHVRGNATNPSTLSRIAQAKKKRKKKKKHKKKDNAGRRRSSDLVILHLTRYMLHQVSSVTADHQ